MRKVIWYEYERTTEPGKNYMEKIEQGEALFHQFGVSYEDFETGPGLFTTAVIELPTGEVRSIDCELVKFREPPVETRNG